MEEDEEYFYDSLDDEPSKKNSALLKKKFTYVTEHASDPSINSSTIQFEECEEYPNTKNLKECITKIPLYIGETNRDELKFLTKKKQTTTSLTTSNRKSTSCLSTSSSTQRRKNALSKEKPLKSYWQIYCQKNNVPIVDDISDTNRSTFGDTTNRTFSTFMSNCGLNGPVWDAPSAFEKYMPSKYALQTNDTFVNGEVTSTRSSSCITITQYDFPEVDVENLRSISQLQLVPTKPSCLKKSKIEKSNSNTTNDEKPKIVEKNKSSTSNIIETKINLSNNKSNLSSLSGNRSLSLKDSGPGEEKMNLLRKQQEYGIKASNRNRAKIQQNLNKFNQQYKESSKK